MGAETMGVGGCSLVVMVGLRVGIRVKIEGEVDIEVGEMFSVGVE